jgi:esterase/lipase
VTLHPLFAALCGRSRQYEQMRVLILSEFHRLEMKMAQNANEVLAQLEALKTQVNNRTTELGKALASAHQALADAEAKGRAAQKAEDEQEAAADKQAALDKIKEISDGLVAFEASGN